MTWLLLLHQIPPQPPYFRARILRRLAQAGALPVKNSAYLLPEADETREDFEWICREIRTKGGAAWLFRAEALGGLTTEQLEGQFRQLRTPDYEDAIAAAMPLLADAASPADHTKVMQRVEQIKKIDFFEHPLRARVDDLVARLHARQSPDAEAVPAATGRIWVTRAGIKADRIASAWLIRKFIDPQAAFRFVETSDYCHAEPELRFDMYQGEFTHQGDLCTFEVLVNAYQLAVSTPAVQPIAELVHDIDLKDCRYERPETQGLARMIDGLCARTPSDTVRLEQGGQLFDALLQGFAS